MTKTELAIHGGQPVRTQPWPSWPQWDETERAGLLGVLERGEWGGYDTAVTEFESAFAARHAAQHCVTTVNGTTTIETALRALEIGPRRRGHRTSLHIHRHRRVRTHRRRHPRLRRRRP